MPPSPIGPKPDGPGSSSEADALLDLLDGLADDLGREELLDHPAIDALSDEQLDQAVRLGLADLAGPGASVAIRLVEALGDPSLYDALADALLDQPDLPVDCLYQAMDVLEGTGRIEAHPELFALREELIEALDDDDASLEGLIEQIEEEPEDVWFALQGLAEIEPEVRSTIVAELGTGGVIGPGTAELLRLLSYAHEPGLRASAIAALESAFQLDGDEPDEGEAPHRLAWLDLATHHPDPEVVARARRWLGGRGGAPRGLPALQKGPRIVASLVSGVDGGGRGHLALVAEDSERNCRVAVDFGCDVMGGIREVDGRVAMLDDFEPGDSLLAELRNRPDCDVVEGQHELALGLLSGALLLCGPDTSPSLRYWLERTAGPDCRPRPFAGLSADPIANAPPPPFEEMPDRVAEVFEACPAWIDDSPLTFELAEELLLRWEGAPPEPDRDAGAYRFLFEHRLRRQLELYRRMLFWMGWLWRAAGAAELSRSALTLVEQLSDPQHVVPAHPFTTALTTRSLAAAQVGLRLGIDPRKPPARARLDG